MFGASLNRFLGRHRPRTNGGRFAPKSGDSRTIGKWAIRCPEAGDADASNRLIFARQAFGSLSQREARASYDEQLAARRDVAPKTAAAKAVPPPADRTTEVSENARPLILRPVVLGVVALAVGIAAVLLMFLGSGESRGKPGVDDTKMGAAAVAALERLNAATEVGINYPTYSQELLNAYVPVKSYLESEEAAHSEPLADKVSEAITLYRAASAIWEIHIKADGAVSRGNVVYYPQLVQAYPEARQFERNGVVWTKSVLQDAWNRASVATAAAADLVER